LQLHEYQNRRVILKTSGLTLCPYNEKRKLIRN
jgi:hypothetical protein